MHIRFFFATLCLIPALLVGQPNALHNLSFSDIPTQWKDGLPLGNGMLGCLVWQKDGKLRLALDRADLWDERPMKGLERPEFSYRWVAEQVDKGEYDIVQRYFDEPYEREAGPTKLPGGALEWTLDNWTSAGQQAVNLQISNGLATVEWADGHRFETFVHAQKQEGWFRCTGFPDPTKCFKLLSPQYGSLVSAEADNSVQGSDLARLGYTQSVPFERNGVWLFQQSGWGEFRYEVAVCMRETKKGVWEGVWSISSHFPQKSSAEQAEITVTKAMRRGFNTSFSESKKWWSAYWKKSSVSIPDPTIERQYYLDLYKFGCTARENSPMISLQAIWTADNGRLPPWKGDLHHDLNTQLSYWPAYASNHLSEGRGYLRHLENNDAAHRAYTRRYFGTSGLNIPGVSTFLGAEMGGWIQYACSPTVAAWCAQHFYLQWRYSQDKIFLRDHAWPWFRDVATHLEELTRATPGSRQRVLPLSSSPETNDNALKAWFPHTWTNYDLALTRFVFEKTAELARALNHHTEAEKWKKTLDELPELALEPNGALMISPSMPYLESHRHFSHLMAIHPLGLLDWAEPSAQTTIKASLARLDSVGTDAWCGYSYAWLANLRARARDGAGARDALRIFAEAFVSKNSFHLNGDQSGKGYSSLRYDPFTLEGNFAFAAGVQEMLLQSHGGVIRVFPAIPADWDECDFSHLRAEGAFLVSAQRSATGPDFVGITAEKGGFLHIELPAGDWTLVGRKETAVNGIWQLNTKKGERLVFLPKVTSKH